MGYIDILDVFFIGWCILAAIVYIGINLLDKSRGEKQAKEEQKPKTRRTQQQVLESTITAQTSQAAHSSYPTGNSLGYGGQYNTNSGVKQQLPQAISTCDWVNAVAEWIYLQKAQNSPSQITSTWLKALNDEAKRQGSTVQVTFEAIHPGHIPPKFHQVNVDRSGPQSLLTVTCDIEAEGIEFGIFTSQQTPSAVKISNCNAVVQKLTGKVQSIIRSFGDEWHVTANLDEDAVLHLKITPQITKSDNVDLHAVEEIVRNAILSATFTIVLPSRAIPKDLGGYSWPRPKTVPGNNGRRFPDSYSTGANHISPRSPTPQEPRLLVKVIKANGLQRRGEVDGDPYCVITMDQPFQRHKTNVVKNTVNPFWDEQFLFMLSNHSKEITFEVHDKGQDDRFLGGTTLFIQSLERSRGSRHIIQLQPRPGFNDKIKGSIALFLLFMEAPDQMKKPLSLSPTRKVDRQQTVAPDGTIITTVTTTTARPKVHGMDRKGGPLDMPTRVVTTASSVPDPQRPLLNGSMSPDSHDGSVGPTAETSSKGSGSPNLGRSAVADTAIRHFQEQAQESRQKTPTKKSTLIIHGVSESPTDDYSQLDASADRSQGEEDLKKGESRASKRRFLFFRKGNKKDPKGKHSRSSSFDEGSVSSRSPEPQIRRSRTVDIPDDELSESVASGVSQDTSTNPTPKKKKKRKLLGFMKRSKSKDRQYHSSVDLQTETPPHTSQSDTDRPSRPAMKSSDNTLKVPGSNQYTRSASTDVEPRRASDTPAPVSDKNDKKSKKYTRSASSDQAVRRKVDAETQTAPKSSGSFFRLPGKKKKVPTATLR